jgi:hypothetical protein
MVVEELEIAKEDSSQNVRLLQVAVHEGERPPVAGEVDDGEWL